MRLWFIFSLARYLIYKEDIKYEKGPRLFLGYPICIVFDLIPYNSARAPTKFTLESIRVYYFLVWVFHVLVQ